MTHDTATVDPLSASTTLTDLRTIADWLFAQGVALVQEPGGGLTVPLDDSAVLILWPEDDEVVQLVFPYDLDVPQSSVEAIESTCVRLNHGLSLPGFGFNHETRVVYYRLPVWAPEHRMDSAQLEALLDVLITTARDHAASFRKVVEPN